MLFELLFEFQQYIARTKPSISECNRQLRLAWADEHPDWTKEQWNKILWTDETWVTGGRPGEELDSICIVEKRPKKRCWVFW